MTVGLLSITASFNWATVDGSTGASATVGQFPTLLTGYVARPPWNVAGVDYGVGLQSNATISGNVITETGPQNTHTNGQKMSFRTIQGGTMPSGISTGTAYFVVSASSGSYSVASTSGGSVITLGGSPAGLVALKVPTSGLMPSGISYDGATTVTMSTSGTVDSFDMSYSGGMTLVFSYTGAVVINNDYFQVGSNLIVPIDAQLQVSSCTVSYCEVDGNGPSFTGQTMIDGVEYLMYVMPSNTVVKYCYLHGALVETISFTAGAAGTFEYNLVSNGGYGPISNHEELFSGQAGLRNYTMQYNTFYQPTGASNGYPMSMDTSMVFFQTQAGGSSVGITVNNNTIVGIGRNHAVSSGTLNNGAFNQGIYMDQGLSGGNNISPVIINNYIDSNSISTVSFCILTDTTVLTPVITGNISMNTGSTIVPNQSGSQ